MGFAVQRSCTKCKLTAQSLLVHQGTHHPRTAAACCGLLLDFTNCFEENVSTQTHTERQRERSTYQKQHRQTHRSSMNIRFDFRVQGLKLRFQGFFFPLRVLGLRDFFVVVDDFQGLGIKRGYFMFHVYNCMDLNNTHE